VDRICRWTTNEETLDLKNPRDRSCASSYRVPASSKPEALISNPSTAKKKKKKNEKRNEEP
jgi:hypothetical protein